MAKNNLNIKLGKGDSRIEEWLNLQTNKSWSLKFLIKQAIRHYGMTDVQAMLEESTLASTHTRRSPSETPTETHIKAQGSPEGCHPESCGTMSGQNLHSITFGVNSSENVE